MALRGTLHDFGIADILQIIGHQTKTGTLTIRHRDQTVHVHFKEGLITGADAESRNEKDLLGTMLVHAEVLKREDLLRLLDRHKKTGRRVGELALDENFLKDSELHEFVRLQVTETLYKLFLWNSGTYEFEQHAVAVPRGFEPIRSEMLLMEGFRQMDEWPEIRKKIGGYGTVLMIIKALDIEKHDSDPSDDLGFDDAFAEMPDSDATRQGWHMGKNEQRVYGLIQPDRPVQNIIRLSRLGEYETCKSLVNLLDAGYVQARFDAVKPEKAEGGAIAAAPRVYTWRFFLGAIIALGCIVAALSMLRPMVMGVQKLWPNYARHQLLTIDLLETLSRNHMVTMHRALAIYRAEYGAYPATLRLLARTRILDARDLRFPWQQDYFYQVEGDSYTLVRPLF